MPKIPSPVIGLGLGLFLVGSAQAQVRTIQPVAALPVITDPVIFDGTTAVGYAGTPVIVLDGVNAGAAVNGLQFSDGSDNSSARGLTIVRFTGDGVLIESGADNIVLTGNWLGTDGNSNPAMGNGDDGVDVFATGVVIGGDTAAAGNVIAFNAGNGVNHPAGNLNAVIYNSIHSNDLLGIDLGGDGVTENDLDDDDLGANGLLNFPEIYSAIESGGIITLAGSFDVPVGNYRFEFFVNPVGADPSGNGEGQTYVGSSTLSHTGSGPEPFGAAFPGSLGDVVTATVTEDLGGTFGSTSEFSDAVVAVAPHAISGIVFEDSDFAGTPTNWDGGSGDLALANIDVELYDASDNYIASTTTAVDGTFSFTDLPDGNTFKVRARSETIGDWDTEPAGGLNATVPASWPYPLAEMTWAGGAALLGGQDPAVDDTDTGDGSGPGDTWVAVTLSGGDAADVNLGFAYNIITNTLDDGSADANRSSQGSLRQFFKNSNAITGVESSYFDIPVTDPGYLAVGSYWSIKPTVSGLPALVDPVVLDAYTQPGASMGNQGFPNALNAVLKVEIDGSLLAGSGAVGLALSAGNSTISGLAVNSFTGASANGINISANGFNIIQGNFLGTDVTGTTTKGNDGYAIDVGTGDNLVGGSTAGAGNLISGSNSYGVWLAGSGNRVEGNLIGTDVTGTQNFGHTASGVGVISGSNISIGGGTAGAGNLISGNGGNGIWFNSSPSNVTVQGNRIGTDISGTLALGNGGGGVLINCPDVTIGGTGPGESNLISANIGGITLAGSTTNAVVQGNLIGTDINGTAALGNTSNGILINSGGNLIGGSLAGSGNVITGSVTNILVTSANATSNDIQGNLIGTDITGTVSLGTGDNIRLDLQASGNTIGGTSAAERNVISGAQNGITISDVGTTGNTVVGNYIGTDVNGTADLGNTVYGVQIDTGASGNTIGGTTPGARNIISGNDSHGIYLRDSGTTGNLIQGNYIGLDATGTAALGNSTGIYGVSGANGNTIGGDVAGAGNVLSGNANGMYLGLDNTTIQGNLVGTNAAGTGAIPNSAHGIYITGSDNTIGGTTVVARNVVSGNSQSGILITNSGVTGNLVQGNFVGTDVFGTGPLPNQFGGIRIALSAADNTIGGTVPEAANIVAYNGRDGVSLAFNAGTGNQILGNAIYDNGALGIDLNDNQDNVVEINDPGDIDSGPNGLQNYPDLATAITDAATTITISGSINSTPSTTYRVEFFTNAAADASGYGEGAGFLGAADITTDTNGDAIFSEPFGTLVTLGTFVSATATDPGGNTSEFSANVVASAPPNFDITGTVFEDVDFAGNATEWDNGTVDAAQPGVDVELYDAGDAILASTVTDAAGFFTFSGLGDGTYKVRARSATLGDAATPPAGGLNPTVPGTWPNPLPEMTWANGAAQIGGQDPTVDDTDTADDSGPGDTWVSVTISGGSVPGVNLGFAYNVVSNTLDDGAANASRSGQGSLRQFLKNSNAITGVETTYFELPVSDPGYNSGGEIWSIQPTLTALPEIADPSIVDGYTQAGASPATQAFPNPIDSVIKVEIDGTLLAGSGESGLTTSAGNSTIQGLAINRFTGAGAHGVAVVSGGSNTIQGTFIGTDVNGSGILGNTEFGLRVETGNNRIGGTSAGEGNLISGNGSGGVVLTGSSATLNLVEGNFIGLDATGTSDLGNSQDGVSIQAGANGNTIGGTAVGAGNVISGNGGEGVAISDAGTNNNIVQGNLIGVDANGTVTVLNDSDGVRVTNGATGNRIGGTAAEARNVISGNGARGILIGSANGTIVEGNYIGVDIGGAGPLGNNYRGIEIGGTSSGNTIGGSADGAGNIVAHNTSNGIVVIDTAVDNRLLGNTIHDNTALDIDLANDGVTANDLGDGDTGPNQLQNYPVLTMAGTSGVSPVRIEGTLNSEPNSTFRIEFFANTNVGGGGNTGPWNYIGTTDVTTDPAGDASFIESVAAGVPVGGYISAIATGPTGNSSEFSAFLTTTAVADHLIIVDTVDDTVDGDDSSIASLIASPGGDGMISLREALNASNNTANDGGPDLVHFDIAGPGPHVIQPASALPTVIDPVIIDGSSEPDFVDTPIVVVSGALAGPGISGLSILAGGSTVRGLVINSFDASGVRLENLGGNTVVGNFIGLDPSGLIGEVGNNNDGILIYQSPNNVIGGTDSADRNIVTSNRLRGIAIDDSGDGPAETSAGNKIVGNYIGTDVNGAARLPFDGGGTIYQQIGIYLLNGVDTQIGGVAPGEGNVISGNDWHGIYVWGPDGHDNLIKGNMVGLDAGGVNAIGNGWESASRSAILLSNAPGNTIGGSEIGASNEIAGNPNYGIQVNGDSAVQNRILANSIYDNGELGIDLELDGVTANDPDDSDIGANNRQNFPVLLSAQTDESSTLTVTGGITSTPFTDFRIEFFGNASADGSGYGEGQTYLGFVDRTTAGSGSQTFNVDLPVTVPAGHWISATATSPTGDTSEFAESIQAVGAADLQLTKVVDNNAPNEGGTVNYTVTVANAGPNDGTGISVTDLLPAGVTYVSDTPSQGSYVSGTGVWTVGNVANSGTATLTLVATVDAGTAGTNVTNNATITAADQADPVVANNTASAVIGVSSADLQIAKVVDNNAPNEGDTVNYTVTVTNVGPNDGTGIEVTDLLPAGVTYVSNTPSQGAYVPVTGIWTVGDVANSASATLTLVATVDAGTAGTNVTNNATITAADQADPVVANNTASAVIGVSSADLQIAKIVDNNAPNEGGTVNYTVTVTNAGPNDGTGIEVTDLLPAGVTYVSDTPSQGAYVPGTGIWTVGDVANSATATLTLVATVDAGTAGTNVTNNATITAADQADPVAANNTASAVIGVSSADLQIAKVVDNNAPNEGDTVTYTVTVTNAGPNDGTGISVTDLLPAGVTYVSDTPSQGGYVSGTGVWTVGNVANAGTATLTMVATVDAGTAGTNVTNNASITAADQADPVAANNTASAVIGVSSADLQITKTVDNNAPDEGGTVTYTVTVSNAGPNDGTGIEVTDLLPAGVTYVSDTPSQGAYVPGSGIWTVGDVANSGTATLTLVATVDAGAAGTNVTNNAAITAADQADPVAANNAASAVIGVSSADLQITKVVDNNAPNEGDTVNYTVTVTNAGPNDGTGIEVTDLLPAGVTYVSDTPSQGAYVSGTGIWTIGDMVNTGTATLTLVATVDAGTAGTNVTNNASITAADQADPVAANNTASAVIGVSSADLQITKIVDNNAPNEGDTVTYTLTVSNAGPDDGSGIIVMDQLPAGLTYVADTPSQGAYDSGAGSWTVGDVANTATATLILTATVDAGTGGSTISNLAAITQVDQADPVTANNTALADIDVQNSVQSVIQITAIPLEQSPILPGGPAGEVLRLELLNQGAQPETLESLMVTNMTVGSGNQDQLDADWQALSLLVDTQGSLNPPNTTDPEAVTSGPFTDNYLNFNGLAVTLTPGETVTLVVQGQASLGAADGDILTVEVALAGDILYGGPALSNGSWPLNSAGGLVVDGMVADQLAMLAVDPTLFVVGSNRNLALDVVLPANGYISDQLHRLNVINTGTATEFADIAKMECWADEGDGLFDPATDTLVGDLEFTGSRWELTGLNLTIPLSGQRIFVSADIAETAQEGRTLQLGLPSQLDVGVGMESGNDGPIDRQVVNPYAQAVSTADRLILSAGTILPGTAYPGQTDVPLMHLVALNSYASDRRLVSVTISNGTVGMGSASQVELDAELDYLKLRVDGNGDGILGDIADDPVIATGIFQAGTATFSGLAWDLASGNSSHLFLTGDVSLAAAADLDEISAFVAGGVDLTFESDVVISANWPLDSGASWTVDGMVAAQVDNHPVPSLTLAAGEGPVLVLDLNLNSNGYADDDLTGLKLVNRGTATANDIADLRLWRDGGDGNFSGGGGDDIDLGPFVWVADTWLSPVLNTALATGGARFFVGLTVSGSPTNSTTVQMAVPVDGITVTSDNDGPVDRAVEGESTFLLSTAPLLAELRFDAEVSTVGQGVTARMQVRNNGTETMLGVTPSALVAGGDGSLGYVRGPMPASFDLAPGEVDSFTWDFTASTTGAVTVSGLAQGLGEVSGQAWPSVTTTSDAHEILEPVTSLELFAVANMPFTINRGQTDVVPLTLTFVNPGSETRSDALVHGLKIRLQDEQGAGIVPDGLLSRVVVNEGGETYLEKSTLESTGNEIDLTLDSPVRVTSLEPVTLGIRLDVRADATVPAFVVEIAAADWFAASGAISNDPVAVVLQDAVYPVQSGLVSLLFEATQLSVAAAPAVSQQVGEGQAGVDMMTLQLLNPGQAGSGSDIRVGSFTVALTDTLGVPIDAPSTYLDRLRLENSFQTLLDISVADHDSTLFTLELSSPLTVPVDTPLELAVVADIAVGAAGAVRLSLADAALFQAIDGHSGQSVPVIYGSNPVTGGPVVIQLAATGLMAGGTPRLPSDLVIGTQQVTAMDVSLRHPGVGSEAAILVESILVSCRNEDRDPVPPAGVIDALEILRAGTVIGSVGNPGGDGDILIPVSGLNLQPGQTIDLTLRLNLEAAASPGSLELVIAGVGIHAIDSNLDLIVPAHPENGEVFPLTSGLTRLQASADELRVDFASLMPAVLVESPELVPTARIVLRNPSNSGVSGISVSSLTIRAADDMHREILIGETAEEVFLYRGEDIWARSGSLTLADTVAVLQPAAAEFIGASAEVELELAVVLRSPHTVTAFRLGFDEQDVNVVQPTGSLVTVRVEPEDGEFFPYWTQTGSFSGASLAASYSNFPNPFAAGVEQTTFVFSLEQPATVSLRLLTGHARPVQTIISEEYRSAGLYQQDKWDGRNGNGVVIQNGVYVAELTVVYQDGTKERQLRKVAIVR